LVILYFLQGYSYKHLKRLVELYLKPGSEQLEIEIFSLPFDGTLNASNRWVKLSTIIPWNEFESEYASHFSKGKGAPSLSFRVALGSLIIKERLKLSDVETVQNIEESPYLQYFLGFKEFLMKPPFDSSMLTHFRKRITPEMLSQINDKIVESTLQKSKTDDSSNDDSDGGTMVIDATCTPADVRYPTDLSLLNECREHSELIIDTLWKQSSHKKLKPRTYRKIARKNFLKSARSKRLSTSMRRKFLRKQLNYLERNIRSINALGNIATLSAKEYHRLLVLTEVHRQQSELFYEKKRSIANRIVNAAQPHIRPIVRGKVGKPTEFGAKISASLVNGFVHLDRISFDSYNESEDLPLQLEQYKKRYGKYPKRVLADQIYRTRKNRALCKKLGISLSGKPLGRPPKDGFSAEEKAQWKKDECDRVPIEGKFGQLKRRFSLGRVMAKLAHNSEITIRIAFLVTNLEKILFALLAMLQKWIKILFAILIHFENKPVIQ
jgi:hypothetical protein